MERPRTPGKNYVVITYQHSTAEHTPEEHMEKSNGKKKKRIPDHFTSEFHRFGGTDPQVPDDWLKDFTGALVIQPRNPNHRPDFKVWIGRTEMVLKDVLRAEDPDGELVRIKVPEEEMVCGGDVLREAFSIKTLDIAALTQFLWELQGRQMREEEEWEKQQQQRKRERRRRYQKRKRARQKVERQAKADAASQDSVASRRSDEVSTKNGSEAVQEPPSPQPRA